MDTPAERSAAYAEFLAGLVDLRQDVATERFDAAIAALEANGGLERGEAGRLRYWQRESLRTQADQLISTAAASLAALDRARADAASAVASADAVWESVAVDVTTVPAATGDLDATATATATATDSTSEPASAAPSADDIDLTIVLVPNVPAPAPEPSLPTQSLTPDAAAPPNRGRHRAPAHAAPRRDTTAPSGHEPALSGPPAEATPAPAEPQGSAAEPQDGSARPGTASPDSPPARRRRLLVAGLTVVDN